MYLSISLLGGKEQNVYLCVNINLSQYLYLNFILLYFSNIISKFKFCNFLSK